MKYQDYSKKDFILDERFQEWVFNPESDNNLFWINFMRQNPKKEKTLHEARQAVLELYAIGQKKEIKSEPAQLNLNISAPGAAEMAAIWENIALATHQPAKFAASVLTTQKSRFGAPFLIWARIAAAVVLLIAVSFVFWSRTAHQGTSSYVTFATTYGEVKKITLPDNSTVFLNANSKLVIPANWSEQLERQVQLTGEAFFKVVHTQNHLPFKVSFAHKAQVQVLGTEFTITDRPTLSRVILTQGKVKVGLAAEGENPAGDYQSQAVMVPGEMVEINFRENKLTKAQIQNAHIFAAFTQNKIEFNNTPLAEVARVLEDNYGYKVTFVPATLAEKRFTSSSPGNRIDLLLFALEKSFNLQVTQRGKNITIKAK